MKSFCRVLTTPTIYPARVQDLYSLERESEKPFVSCFATLGTLEKKTTHLYEHFVSRRWLWGELRTSTSRQCTKQRRKPQLPCTRVSLTKLSVASGTRTSPLHPLVPRRSLASSLIQIASNITLDILHVTQGLHGQLKQTCFSPLIWLLFTCIQFSNEDDVVERTESDDRY